GRLPAAPAPWRIPTYTIFSQSAGSGTAYFPKRGGRTWDTYNKRLLPSNGRETSQECGPIAALAASAEVESTDEVPS
ncbi:MAG: hypothetical protein SGJ20_16330, partial [Planctomycetota bacterium]|nr:hypothetical protein [Planctomycetota bacterium]